MSVAVVERIVNAVQGLNAFARVKVKHIVKPIPFSESVVISGNGNKGNAFVNAAERAVIKIPFFVGAVVCKVSEVCNKVCVRVLFKSFFQHRRAFFKVFFR